jgi:hypothetical protein
MIKPNSTTDINDAVSIADEAIDEQTGGAGEQARVARAVLRRMNDTADAAIKIRPLAVLASLNELRPSE